MNAKQATTIILATIVGALSLSALGVVGSLTQTATGFGAFGLVIPLYASGLLYLASAAYILKSVFEFKKGKITLITGIVLAIVFALALLVVFKVSFYTPSTSEGSDIVAKEGAIQEAVYANNSGACSTLSILADRDYCYQAYAMHYGPQFCSLISADSPSLSDRNRCYTVIAQQKHDASICSAITDRAMRQSCVFGSQ